MRNNAALIAILFTPLLLTGCDPGSARKVIDFTECAAKDSSLSVALKNPKKAVRYLDALVEANEKGQRIDETIDLARRLQTCVKAAS